MHIGLFFAGSVRTKAQNRWVVSEFYFVAGRLSKLREILRENSFQFLSLRQRQAREEL